MKKIRFIINPKSGVGKKGNLPTLIKDHLNHELFESEICFTEAAGHATILAKEAAVKNYDVVAVVGGDGSVNETAKALTGTSTSLGIIPAGSGNGMALHLKIPVDAVKALELINRGNSDVIDTLTVNEHFCIGTIGIGFDAHVAHLFAASKKRGYSTYVKLVLTEFYSYKEKKFSILVDGIVYERDCFLLTFGNSSQFGNNAVIAPFADVKDGIIEVSVMKRFPIISAPMLIFRLMNNSIQNSKYFEGIRGKSVVVKNNGTIKGHIDGEPVLFNSDLEIKMHSLSLRVIVP